VFSLLPLCNIGPLIVFNNVDDHKYLVQSVVDFRDQAAPGQAGGYFNACPLRVHERPF
jgi:hypothetical protein